jgi:uncharacterized protein with PQ loop repeat
MIETLGMIAGITLPLWNIPLIARIQKRRSSKDMSLAWVWGVEVCLLCMLPAGLHSSDLVFKVFSIINVVFFTGVFIQVLRFRRGA